MLEIITDRETVEEQSGIDSSKDIVGWQIAWDSTKSNSPIFVKVDGDRFLIARQVDAGNYLEVKVRNAKVIYYSPYFTFSNVSKTHETPREWADLVIKYFPNEKDCKVHGDIAVGYYWSLGEKLSLTLETESGIMLTREQCEAADSPIVANSDVEPVLAYAIYRKDVISSFADDGEVLRHKAIQVSEQLTDRDKVRACLDGMDSRFDLLDQLLDEEHIETLLLSSPLNIQETTALGVFMPNRPDVLAVYRRGDPKIYILSPEQFSRPHFVKIGSFANRREALKSLIQEISPVGIEEFDLPMERCISLGLKKERLKGVSQLLRMWREQRAGEELSYHLIAGQVTLYAIERALHYAETSIKAGQLITEMDVSAKLYAALSEFGHRHELVTSVRPYFLILHSGSRTLFAAVPANYTLVNIKSLKIDSGILLIDSEGRLRAVSDLCRTLNFTEEGRELYSVLNKLELEAIPSVRPGLLSETVYDNVLKSLQPYGARLKDIGIMPVKFDLQNLARNVGHSLGKQEVVRAEFRSGNKTRLSTGMICTLEFQWPFDEYAVGVEDMFLVTEQGGINITR